MGKSGNKCNHNCQLPWLRLGFMLAKRKRESFVLEAWYRSWQPRDFSSFCYIYVQMVLDFTNLPRLSPDSIFDSASLVEIRSFQT